MDPKGYTLCTFDAVRSYSNLWAKTGLSPLSSVFPCCCLWVIARLCFLRCVYFSLRNSYNPLVRVDGFFRLTESFCSRHLCKLKKQQDSQMLVLSTKMVKMLVFTSPSSSQGDIV